MAASLVIWTQEVAAIIVRALGRLGQLAEVRAGEAAQIPARFSDRQAPWAADALAVTVRAGKSST